MVEGTGLENRRARKGLVSSNLTLSVRVFLQYGRAVTLSRGLASSGLGWVAEWLKAHAWKACGLERVSRVRISPHPYLIAGNYAGLASREFGRPIHWRYGFLMDYAGDEPAAKTWRFVNASRRLARKRFVIT